MSRYGSFHWCSGCNLEPVDAPNELCQVCVEEKAAAEEVDCTPMCYYCEDEPCEPDKWFCKSCLELEEKNLLDEEEAAKLCISCYDAPRMVDRLICTSCEAFDQQTTKYDDEFWDNWGGTWGKKPEVVIPDAAEELETLKAVRA